MNKRFAPVFPALVTALLALTCLTITLITLYVLWVSHWHGPFRDMWEIYSFLEKIVQHTWSWNDLWESYGYAHRLLIPRLLFVADYTFADASNHLLITVALLCQIGICIVFARVLFAQSALLLWQRWSLFLLVASFQFSGTLLFNLMHTFDVQWFLCCFFVTTSFYLMTVEDFGKHSVWLAGSGILIVLACLSNFSAMAAWPVWMLFVFFRSDSIVRRSVPILVAMLFIAVYAVGIRSAGADAFASVNLLVRAVYFLVLFPLMYLGNPVSDPDYLPFGAWAMILVVAPLILLVHFGWKYLKERIKTFDQGTFFLVALVLFCFGVAVMTGLGRGYDPSHVYASRYQNIVMLFWSAAVPLIFIQTKKMPLMPGLLFRASAVFIVLGFITCQWQAWNENLLLGRNVSRSHLALMMGYSEDVPMISATVSRSMIYVPGYNLEKERLLHEQARKGVYGGAMGEAWLNGLRLSELSMRCENVEWNITDRLTPYTRFVEFTVTGEVKPYDYALLVDEAGSVVALAEPETEVNLKRIIQSKLKNSPVLLRGYSQRTNTQNLFLVMLSPGNSCFIPLKT